MESKYVDDLLRQPPPELPGRDPKGELHFFRDVSQFDPSVSFVSKTISNTDPFFIQLAYADLDEDIAPTQVLFLASMVVMMQPLHNFGTAEAEAHQAIISGSAQMLRAALKRLILPSMQADDLIELWQMYHALTVWVLYIWGGVGTVTVEVAKGIGQRVGDIWLQSRRIKPALPGPPGSLFRLEEAQKWQRIRGGDWDVEFIPHSFGTLAEQLRAVISSAGKDIRQCGNCQRLFLYQGRGQRFCSSQCRNASFMRNKRKLEKEIFY